MPPEPIEFDRRTYSVVSKSFTELLDHARSWRHVLSLQNQQASICQFASAVATDAQHRRFYALGTCAGSRDHTILYADIPSSLRDTGAHAVEALPVLEWKPLLRGGQDLSHVMTKEEQLLRERMRCMVQGITAYDYEASSGTFLFSASGHLYRCMDDQKGGSISPSPVDVPLNVSGTPLDPKICPANAQLVACVCRNDVYIHYGPTARQVTFSHDGEDGGAPKLCGVASFIVQEEFDRFTGYWWRPISENDTYYIMYEETDESSVLELSISIPATRAEHLEMMRYPRTGTNNPSWTLKLLKIQLLEKDNGNFDSVKDPRIEERHLSSNLRQLFPWAEYMVRAGWLPDGRGVWFQVMSRIQDRIALVYAPMDVFGVPGQPAALARGGQAESMEDLTASGEKEQTQLANVSVLYEEYTSGLWINCHDILQFLTVNDTEAEFLWLSGKSGFYHLYHVTSAITGSKMEQISDYCTALATTLRREVQLTSGDWDIRRKCQIHVDKGKKLVYFVAFKDSPLETHIYVTSYDRPGQVRLLTEPGYSHGGPRDARPFCISPDGHCLVTSRCNLSQPGECVVYWLSEPAAGDHLPQSTLLCKLNKNTLFGASLPSPQALAPGVSGLDNDDSPVLFTYSSHRTGFTHYSYLFKPRQAVQGVKYPTLLYIYAGPEMQLVKNVWMGTQGFQKYTSLGYAVVIADGRGSPNRGVRFEATLKGALGTFEIEDQVEILTDVANRSGLVDLERIGLLGWSYGGYMALLGLAQRPDIFKVAIAGAPVTVWSLYDTAYTERYMGLPQFNQEGYVRSSVLSYVDQLPSECGRLLLLHGLIDENVHFRHTTTLINALIRAGKPYQLQVYPADRHACRNSDVNEHMDATILEFLQRNL